MILIRKKKNNNCEILRMRKTGKQKKIDYNQLNGQLLLLLSFLFSRK